ncbi:origin recognition complex subunit 3 N-terminus-domain-containing protein [Rhodofomes roseus]|uniref:Origin recognition complex subunit 3 N-terminus-domain-containing protein n=1 Tax=Rhodofomes roseus TaxID=34475 RepID=A0ABQ8JZ31_9APHY|nr:origin recognition complex subunit 3 N-terminus-domain-containing protein [Rhodofomes roseus]KAH9829557.1 origin recognition complex subunit 3 N-terminus-domain-containing protein [Rhodofomes roseus]
MQDQTQPCVYLSPDDEEHDDGLPPEPLHPSQWRDLPSGYVQRMKVYKTLWARCLSRMQTLVHAIHAPVACEVALEIKSAYEDQLPGLPYHEIPVIALAAEPGSPIYADVVSQLESPSTVQGQERRDLLIHLHPSECPNLLSMMRAVVTGFTAQSGTERRTRSAVSLANYDFARLQAWYRTLDSHPNLVVFVHDFEQFDVGVVQDALYICSLHVPRVPLVFVLGLTSPSTPTHLHKAYARSTLALLRIRAFTAPSGQSVTEEVLARTYFDPTFEPDIMIGPATLDFLHDFASRHTSSLDALYTVLQLAHMKHFTEPLTVLADASSDAHPSLTDESARPFVSALALRLQRSTDSAPDDLLDAVQSARAAFHRKARELRVALAAAEAARRIGQMAGAHSVEEEDALQFARAVLRGRVEKEVRYLGMVVRKLPAEQLGMLLAELLALFEQVGAGGDGSEEGTPHAQLQNLFAQLPRSEEGEDGNPDADGPPQEDGAPGVRELSDALGGWLVDFLEQRFVRLDEGPLWDMWYMGNTPFPAELINPAPRLAVVSALTHPSDFARAHCELLEPAPSPSASPSPADPLDLDGDEEDEGEEALWELPDASILFRRYVEAGRMVNVYDWFQSFAVVLEGQRRRLRKREREAEGEDEEESEEEGASAEEESEEWVEEVQARFMRALHTLDWMGFVRHTGRKADHIIRTVYDVLD